MTQLTIESIADYAIKADKLLFTKAYELSLKPKIKKTLQGKALKDLNGMIWPRIFRNIWLKLGKLNNIPVKVKGARQSDEKLYNINLNGVSAGFKMDTTHYIDDIEVLLVEIKSNYIIGQENTILKALTLSQHYDFDIWLVSPSKGYSEKRAKIYEILANNTLKVKVITGEPRSTYDKRWLTGKELPKNKMIEFIKEVNDYMLDKYKIINDNK